METLHNGFTLDTPPGTFPLSTDSMLLADFVRLPKNAHVLDLGSGCGTLGVLLCAKDSVCHVTGVELDEKAHNAALNNIHANALEGRMESIFGDLRHLHQITQPGHFSCCVSNPPYFSAGAVSQTVPLARHDQNCSMDALFQTAAKALKFGGDFFLVQKPDALARICFCAIRSGLDPKKLCFVRHSPGNDISLILIQCRKGGKPGLLTDELCLFDEHGHPTDAYQRIYHL